MLRLALLLVTGAAGRYVLLVQGPSDHQPALTVDVAGTTQDWISWLVIPVPIPLPCIRRH